MKTILQSGSPCINAGDNVQSQLITNPYCHQYIKGRNQALRYCYNQYHWVPAHM